MDGCFSTAMVRGSAERISLHPSSAQSSVQSQAGPGLSHTDRPSTAPSTLVFTALGPLSQPPLSLLLHSGLISQNHACLLHPDLQVFHLTVLEASWLTSLEESCSGKVQEVLLNIRKLSARTTYLAK